MINLKQIMDIVFEWSKIKRSFFGSIVIFGLILLFSETMYKSSFSIYPFYEEDDIQSQIASVATTYGFLDSKSQNSFYLPDLIHSKSSLKPLLERDREVLDNNNLINYYNKNPLFSKIKFYYGNFLKKSNEVDYQNFLSEVAFNKLKKNIKFVEEYSGLTTISVLTHSKILSQNLAKELFEVLNDFYNEKSQLQAKEAIVYLKNRMEEIEIDIEKSEQKYSTFKNDNIIVESPDLILMEKSLLNDLNQDYFALNSLNNELEIELVNQIKTENYLVILDTPSYPTLPHGSGMLKILIYCFVFIHLMYCLYRFAIILKKEM